MINNIIFKKLFYVSISLICIQNCIYAKTCPLELINTSTNIPDEEIYWAVIGQVPNAGWSYLDISTGNTVPLKISDNQMVDPNGNPGPNGHNPGKYSNYFYRFTDYTTIQLPEMYGARIFISVGSPLFLYSYGTQGGYSGINHLNPNDPNHGILYEVIEFTLDDNGYHGNTTRVDEFCFPISMQLEAMGGYDRIVGEYESYETIFNGFLDFVDEEFLGCVVGNIIRAPGKTVFYNGAPYDDYFDEYVDALWSKYRNQDLVFKTDIGEFIGRVHGEEFRFTRTNDQQVATVSSKPSTIEIVEGKGVLSQDNGNNSFDLAFQARFCASLNRHMVERPDWTRVREFYQQNPCNHYAKYWHSKGISYGNLAYGFCYDDVFGQSTLLTHKNPEKVTVRLGGGGSDDFTGGLGNMPNVGGEAGKCDDTLSVTGLGLTFDYAYSFKPVGDQVLVTFKVLDDITGLVSVIQNMTEEHINEKIQVGAEISQTFSYELGEYLTVRCKWLFPGGDAFSKELIYEMGTHCGLITDVFQMSDEIEQAFIYPNPAQDKIFIIDSDVVKSVFLYNFRGENVYHRYFESQVYELNISELPSGVYIVQINNINEKQKQLLLVVE